MRIFLSVLMGLFASLLVPSTCTADAATVLFSETFESESFSQWDSVGTNWEIIQQGVGTGVQHSGYFKGRSPDGIIDSSLAKNIPTVGYTEITLSYYFRISKNVEASDHLVTEWSPNGTTWNILEDLTSSASFTQWATRSFSLSGAENQSGFRFRFRGTMDAANDEVRVDSVQLRGENVDSVVPTDTASPSGRVSSGTLILEKYIQGGTLTPGDFTFTIAGESDRFGLAGRNDYIRHEGSYIVNEVPVVGYNNTYGGACDAQGLVSVLGDRTVTCTLTSTAVGWTEEATEDLTVPMSPPAIPASVSAFMPIVTPETLPIESRQIPSEPEDFSASIPGQHDIPSTTVGPMMKDEDGNNLVAVLGAHFPSGRFTTLVVSGIGALVATWFALLRHYAL